MPLKTLWSREALCFRDIHFVPAQHMLKMQHMSLRYLKSLIQDDTFQPASYKPTNYNGSTAILIVFHSDREHKGVEHIFIGLVVRREESSIYMQVDILTFMESIEVDLKKARDMHEEGLDPGRRHSYCLLLTNYRGFMAIPTDPPYCLVYRIVYHENIEDPSHFNTSANPSGMCTHSCMCHTLLQHADMEQLHQRTFEGSRLIIPCGEQYRTLFPKIVAPRNQQGSH